MFWVLLGFWALWTSDIFAYSYISDFRLYVVNYILDVYFIYWISSMDVDFQIFINGDYRYYYLSYYFYYFETDGVFCPPVWFFLSPLLTISLSLGFYGDQRRSTIVVTNHHDLTRGVVSDTGDLCRHHSAIPSHRRRSELLISPVWL